jgi:hypothetical protein
MTVLLISKVFSQQDSETEPLLSPSRDRQPPAFWPAGAMSSEDPRETKCDHCNRGFATIVDPDAEFGGREVRQKLKKRLLLKVDARMSLLLVIYILNYVGFTRHKDFRRVFRYSLHTDR